MRPQRGEEVRPQRGEEVTSPKTREDVVRAAGRLFAERGYHGTSMRDLGQELGLLGSSLYSHIEGKDQLLLEVIRRGGAMFAALAEEVVATGGTAAEQLRRLVVGHVAIITEFLDESATFLEEGRFLPAEPRAELVELRDAYEDAYRAVLTTGARSHEFHNVDDPALTSTLILSMLNALVRWYRPSGRLSPEEIADGILALVMEGVS